jgi:glycosyltransferase involved in cell wall biosynthesis
MTIRVAHMTHNAQGGAGRAALRARDACRAVGMVSEFFCLDGAEKGQDVIQPKWLRNSSDPATRYQDFMFRQVQWSDIADQRRGPSNTLLSQPYPGNDLLALSALNTFDVLHMHWTTWTVTPPDIRRWLDAGRALVWTMHDAWPMTGGCHYPSGCDQYLSECIVCPQMNDAYSVIPNAFADKLRQYGNDARLQIIAPSKWLADEAKRSRIFAQTPVHHIENPIELDIFMPRDARAELRAELGFADTDVVLLFGNHLNEEIRKGGAVLREALAELLTSPEIMARWQARGLRPAMLTFGTPIDLGEATRGFKMLSIDSVRDDKVLVDLFNVADVLCFPSLEDNYPNTVVEAAACGTPSIVFRTGGMTTMVEHGRTGLVVDEVGDSSALAAAIDRFAQHHFADAGMRQACRAQTESLNAPSLVGTRFKVVYEEALCAKGIMSSPLVTPPSLDGGISPTAKAVHQLSTVRVSPRVGADFLRHPLNRRVAHLVQSGQDAALKEAFSKLDASTQMVPTPIRAGCVSVALASSLHSHHASYAGPYQFARHLDRKNFELRHYRTPLGDDLVGSAPAVARARQFGRLLGLEGYANQPNAMLTEFDILADLQSTRYDVVHFLDGELCGWLLPRAARRLLGVQAPAVVMSLHQPPELLERMITLERLHDIDIVLALCESQAEFLREYAPDVQVRVVPHGISTEFFKPQLGSRDFSTPDQRPFQLLGVGHWLRDYPMALDAIEHLNAQGMPCEYTIICHNFPASLQLPRNVRVVSGLSDEELLASYRQADALLLPMDAATANNAILESMASGLPVFSSDVGGIAEMTGGAAFLAKSGDSQFLAKGIYHAAYHPEVRQQMIKAGLARAQSLSWDKVARQMEAIYQEAITLKERHHVAC